MKTNRDLMALKNNYLIWLKFVEIVESLLKKEGYTKILTPYLVHSGAMESQLEPFCTQHKFGQKKVQLQLPTSPEFRLKEALSAGFGDLFEIKTCFRNEEDSPIHRAEFLMLEFYKTQVKLPEFIQIVLNLLEKIYLQFQDMELVTKPLPSMRIKILKISDIFSNLGLDLKPESSLSDFRTFAQKVNVEYLAEDTVDEIYYRIWIEKIEPNFDPQVLTVVHSYLPSQAALAKLNPEGWADRFEIYWQGFELGNAFYELADSKQVEKRWISENEIRRQQGKQPHVIDYEFLKTLDHLPESCGIAIGLERLFMAICGFKDIGDFRFFD
jgi:elongation factor P--(R)-beta-lysine ligase